MGKEKKQTKVVENPEAIVEAESGARNPTGAFPKKFYLLSHWSGQYFNSGMRLHSLLFSISLSLMTQRHGPYIWPLRSFWPLQRFQHLKNHRRAIFPYRIGCWD